MKQSKVRSHLWSRQLGEGSSSVPSVCYPSCDSAYLEAQRTGRDPELCEEDSVFFAILSDCRACIEENTSDPEAVERNYLTPNFQQWLDYCNSLPAETVISTRTAETQVTETLIPPSNDPGLPVTSSQATVVAPIPSTKPPAPAPIETSIWTSIKSDTPNAPSLGEPLDLPATERSTGKNTGNPKATAPFSVSISASAPPAAGGNIIETTFSRSIRTLASDSLEPDATNSRETAVLNSLGTTASNSLSTPISGSPTNPTSDSPNDPTSTSLPPPTPNSLDTPTLTGIIAGSVIAALFLLAGIIYLIRPRRQQNKTPSSSDTWPGGKAQLHGKSLTPRPPPPELLDTWFRELGADSSARGPSGGLSYAELGELRALRELRDLRELCELRELRELRELSASTGMVELEKTYDLPRYELDGGWL